MTTQELIDYLVAQVQEHPELAARHVAKWDDEEIEFRRADAQVIWIDPANRNWANEPYKDFEKRIEIL